MLDKILTGIRDCQQGERYTYIDALLNIDYAITDNYCTITVPILSVNQNTLKLPHGGVVAKMADTCMGTHANHVIADGHSVVTSNLTMHYVTSAKLDTLTAKSQFFK
ncbi:PaaI family thioesterase [Viridibacillus sp. YIM B01967]|uniref:PaaI family thioesterase n=1 Tax=Viridibacillus soli TaxID=2798301 RepID=A0ABS1H7P7_9BACL|nr:PaaI family thioesterase [Viridibacillus soli]MBK3495436.1 PaaI family thioesterase [Viridibacillus soli]